MTYQSTIKIWFANGFHQHIIFGRSIRFNMLIEFLQILAMNSMRWSYAQPPPSLIIINFSNSYLFKILQVRSCRRSVDSSFGLLLSSNKRSDSIARKKDSRIRKSHFFIILISIWYDSIFIWRRILFSHYTKWYGKKTRV